MKSLSASVVSSEPVSVKAAARILSRFICKDNGASKTVSSYLKRTYVSINELIQFHRQLKFHQSSLTHKKSTSENVNDGHQTDGAISPLKENISKTEPEIVAVERKKSKEEIKNERRNEKSRKKRKMVEIADKGEASENEEHRKEKKRRKGSHAA